MKIEGKIKIAEMRKNRESEDDRTLLGFAAFETTEYPSLTELLTNEDNCLIIQEKSYRIEKRESIGYEYVCRVPIEDIPEEYMPFTGILYFRSPRITQDIYIMILPEFFKADPDALESSEKLTLEMENREYYFEDTPCCAVIGLEPNLSPKRVFARVIYTEGEEYWFHIVRRKNKNWPIILAAIAFFTAFLIALVQCDTGREDHQMLLQEIKRKSGYWIKYEDSWKERAIRKLHRLFKL